MNHDLKKISVKLEAIEMYLEAAHDRYEDRFNGIEQNIIEQDRDISTQDTAILEMGRSTHKNERAIAKIWHFIKNLGTLYQTI